MWMAQNVKPETLSRSNIFYRYGVPVVHYLHMKSHMPLCEFDGSWWSLFYCFKLRVHILLTWIVDDIFSKMCSAGWKWIENKYWLVLFMFWVSSTYHFYPICYYRYKGLKTISYLLNSAVYCWLDMIEGTGKIEKKNMIMLIGNLVQQLRWLLCYTCYKCTCYKYSIHHKNCSLQYFVLSIFITMFDFFCIFCDHFSYSLFHMFHG